MNDTAGAHVAALKPRGADAAPAAQSGLAEAAQSVVAEHVGALLEDARILLTFVARRGGASSSQAAAASLPATPDASPPPLLALISNGTIDVDLLTCSPVEIARDGVRLRSLFGTIAVLNKLAAPATVYSIRLTEVLLGTRSDGNPPPEAAAMGRRLIRALWISGTFGLAVFAVVIMLLIHVDRGRRAVQQLEQERALYQTALAQATSFQEPLQTGAAGDTSCAAASSPSPGTMRPDAMNPGTTSPETMSRITQRQFWQACRQLDGVVLRMRIAYRELDRWNYISERLFAISPLNWFIPATPLSTPGLTAEEWQSTELRTSLMMGGLTGFVLPMLLGLLGACTYVYRSFDSAVGAYSLTGSEGLHGMLRILLGAILGGLLGLIWTNGQGVQLEGVTLSLGAIAFFVGFSVEMVFRVLDSVIAGLASRMAKSP